MTKILVVEDDVALSRLYKLILETEGFQIIQAMNGKEAVDVFKSQLHYPDIVLMDHRMPIKNGIEASKEILEIDKKTKIIFLSADSTVESDAISLGVKKFVKKPFLTKQLIREITNVLSLQEIINISR